METIEIQTLSQTYPVWIGGGLRHRSGQLLNRISREFSSFLIITDEVVAEYYLDDVLAGLQKKGHVYHYVVKHGEQAKSFQTYYDCQSFALEKGLDRKSAIIALGGGVVGDLAGFVAATYMRGIGFIQMPTTLLAHDSSVGGKTGINHPLGKNLIGSFYQPDAVIYDSDTLATLSSRELRSGFAEVVKESLIGDALLYEILKESVTSPEDVKNFRFEGILKRAIEVKAKIVAEDEKESGVRAYLNFGHTLGHALEAELGYGKMTHGEAVAIGMVFAMRVSEIYYGIRLPVTSFKDWLSELGYSVAVPVNVSPEALLTRMKRDKKTEHNEIHFVVMKAIGDVDTAIVEDRLILDTFGFDRK